MAEFEGAVVVTALGETMVVDIEGTTAHVTRLLHHRHGRCVRVLVLVLPAGEVVFEWVEVGRVGRDLAEDDGQPGSDANGDEVKKSDNGRNQKGGKQQRICTGIVLVEDVPPSRLRARLGNPVLVGKPRSVDVEGNQTAVHHHAEDVIA